MIAHLRRYRGIKGELIGHSLTSHPERFQELKRVVLRRENGEIREAMVQKVWDFRGDPIFKFVGVDSISEAERLAGYDVCVPVSERFQVAEDEFFFSDVVGCEAVSMDGGERYGKVVASMDNGVAQVWFEIEPENGKKFLVPFHRSIFLEIDVTSKVVRLDLPEGLRELN